MNKYSDDVVPNWPGFSRIWKIVAIALAVLCALLWLLGYGPGGKQCAHTAVVADASQCDDSVAVDRDRDASGTAAAVGGAAVSATTAVAASSVTDAESGTTEAAEEPIVAAPDVGDQDSVLPGYTLDSSIAAARLYFDSSSYELPGNSTIALGEVLDSLIKRKDTVAIISGFHDPSGSLSYNRELSKNRALAVRDLMVTLGLDEKRLLLEEPVQTTGSGTKEEARRVEVSIATLNN